MLTLHHLNNSRSQRILWLLEELGLPYDLVKYQRGSPVPLFIAGAPVLANYPFGPRTGTALNATVLTYCDDLNLGLNIDPAAITDVDAFMADLADSFNSLLDFA